MSDTIHHPDQLDLEGSADVPRRPSRKMPAKPFITREFLTDDDDQCRGVVRQWTPMPRGRVLTWLMLAPRRYSDVTKDEVIIRLTRWSYRLGFGGFLAVSLYPIRVRSLLELDAWAEDLGDQLRREKVLEHIRFTAGLANEHDSKTLVLATGPLTEDWQIADFRAFGDYWDAHAINRRRWRCIGVNEHGWPLAPVSRGRAPPADDADLEPWKMSRVRHLVQEDDKTKERAAAVTAQARLDRGRRKPRRAAQTAPVAAQGSLEA